MANQHHKYYYKYNSQDKNKGYWTCALCSHYLPKPYGESIQNRISICWNCEHPMEMNTNQLRMDYPECDKCLRLKKSQ